MQIRYHQYLLRRSSTPSLPGSWRPWRTWALDRLSSPHPQMASAEDVRPTSEADKNPVAIANAEDRSSLSSDDEAQAGVKGIEAISQTWTKWSLVAAYLGLVDSSSLLLDMPMLAQSCQFHSPRMRSCSLISAHKYIPLGLCHFFGESDHDQSDRVRDQCLCQALARSHGLSRATSSQL